MAQGFALGIHCPFASKKSSFQTSSIASKWNGETYVGIVDLDVSKNRVFSPKMDGENHGKPYFLMDDLGVNLLFLETPKFVGPFGTANFPPISLLANIFRKHL